MGTTHLEGELVLQSRCVIAHIRPRPTAILDRHSQTGHGSDGRAVRRVEARITIPGRMSRDTARLAVLTGGGQDS
jgi:hypothetical protein